jgi:hypothetical protein
MALCVPITSCAPLLCLNGLYKQRSLIFVLETLCARFSALHSLESLMRKRVCQRKIGGLGVRRVVDHAAGAFTASWHEAGKTAVEKWSLPVSCGPAHQPQNVASAALDRATMDGVRTNVILNAFVV